MNIPENTQGSHKVILETRPIGQTDYRWAMFRAPVFQFDTRSSAATKDLEFDERMITCQ